MLLLKLALTYRAVVFLVHGLAEHSGRYVPLIKALTSGGIAVLTHDHHGHGLSDGERIFVNTFDDYVEDIFQHLKIADHRIGNLPLLLFGHSMGGLISLLCAVRDPIKFKCISMISPALTIPLKWWEVYVLRCINPLFPRLVIGKLNPSELSRNPDSNQNYLDDKLNYLGGINCKWIVKCLDGIDKVFDNIETIKNIPLFVLQGDSDKITPMEGSVSFFEKLPKDDQHQLKIIKGGFHQLHCELPPMGEQTVEDLTSWLKTFSKQ